MIDDLMFRLRYLFLLGAMASILNIIINISKLDFPNLVIHLVSLIIDSLAYWFSVKDYYKKGK